MPLILLSFALFLYSNYKPIIPKGINNYPDSIH